ncbi:MAG: ATP-binding protein, partial [Prevotellaceae bacterium]|nr:ATP-binding protein [Prevotellaceae bacterium]
YFSEHIEETAKEIGIGSDELLEKMRDYYDGFCFDGVHRLYNPFSTLNFFGEKRFMNFWMHSGASKMIADYLQTHKLTVEQFRNFPMSIDFANEPGNLDSTLPAGFLYQAGYLTLREGTTEDFALDYPNTEVLNSMSVLLAQNIFPTDNSFVNIRQLLLIAMEDRDIDGFVESVNALLANIPYDDFSDAGRQSVKVNRLKFPVQEWLYRSTIIAFFRGCGVVTFAEMHTNLGRADLVISHRGKTYVIELKVAYKSEDVPAKLSEAVDQMKRKNYLAPYLGATGLALVIDDTKRQIVENGYTVVIQ